MKMLLVLDNYDSFTYNLVQYLGELGAHPWVVRNDRATVEELVAKKPDRVVISPGPCRPVDAGISIDLIKAFAATGTPILGVCLGHQAIAEAFGGSVSVAEPIHGKVGSVEHDGKTIYKQLENPFEAGRYHSLVVDPELPEVLEQSAFSADLVMGIRHRQLPIEGVQFHPESILTGCGKKLLANFLALEAGAGG